MWIYYSYFHKNLWNYICNLNIFKSNLTEIKESQIVGIVIKCDLFKLNLSIRMIRNFQKVKGSYR